MGQTGGMGATGREEGPVLLVTPGFRGHRLTWCRALAALLREAGQRVVVAGDREDARMAHEPALAALESAGGVEVRHLAATAAGEPAAVAALAAGTRARLVLHLEAERLRGPLPPGPRRAGLLLRTGPPRPRRRGARPDLRLPAPLAALDVALPLDERLAALAGLPWFPDVFREWPAASGGGDGDAALGGAAGEAARWREELAAFLGRHPRRPVVVYVGTNQARRGYDRLLRLAVREDAVFLHCGRLEPWDGRGGGDVAALRGVLKARGTILETAAPYRDPATAELFLRAARCVLLPYREHKGSSGALLQAVAAGRPVAVPPGGLMAWRVRTFGLGLVVRGGEEEWRRAFRRLAAGRVAAWAPRLAAFAAAFSRDQVAAAVAAALGSGPGARLPQEVVFGRREVDL